MYTVNLVRERVSGDEVWVDTFLAEDWVSDPEQALRAAVAEYLETAEGLPSQTHCSYDFNWGDAIMFVPETLWVKHGLTFNYVDSTEVRVNQDEVLWGNNK